MSNKPRALSFVSGAHGQGPLDAVQAIGLRMTGPVGGGSIEFRSIALTKDDPGDALLEEKPLVDEFWPVERRKLAG